MKLSDLQRWGGWAIIAGAAFLTVWAVCWTTLLPVQERMRDFTLLVGLRLSAPATVGGESSQESGREP